MTGRRKANRSIILGKKKVLIAQLKMWLLTMR